jgi:iron complex outermembrane receptor protein
MKRKNIYILPFLLLLSELAIAQCTLQGTITGKEEKSPLAGALIYLPDLKKGTATDENGKYLIEGLPTGKYLAEIKLFGYASMLATIETCKEPVRDFELSASVIEAGEVVVTGSSKATELKKNPGAITTINNTALLRITSTNMIDALSSKPGITQISTGSGISKPVIRGLGYNRVVILNDGVRQEGQQWGDEHGIEIDEFSANKIEILKGPASVMYGSDALAGVINIIGTPTPAPGTIGASITTGFQSNNSLATLSAMQNGNIKNINWMVRASSKQAQSYHNRNDGRVFNSGYTENNYSGTIGLNKKWGYSHLTMSSFNQKLGLIEGERDSATGKFVRQWALNDSTVIPVIATGKDLESISPVVPKQTIRHNKIACDNNFILGKSRLSVLLAYQHNLRKEFGDPLAPDEAGIQFSLSTFTYDIKYFLPEKKGWQLSLGSSGMMQQNRNLGSEFIIPEYRQMDAGLFVYVKKDFTDKLNMAGGIRFDNRNYSGEQLTANGLVRFDALSRNFRNASGSVGATYEPNRHWVVKANLARGYRAPQAAELSSNGRHEGTFRFEIGNAGLEPETSLQADLGIMFNSSHVSLDAAVFSNSIDHFIYLAKLRSVNGGDSIVDITDPAPAYRFIQGNAMLNGAEITLDIHPHPLDWLHFENTFAYVNAINKGRPDSSRYLPFSPPIRITSELQADIKKLNSRFVNFYVLINAQICFKQDHVLLENNTETPTPGYTLFNAGMGSDVKDKKGGMIGTLVFAVNNLTDVAYQAHLSRLKYAPMNYVTGRTGVYNMGRNFSVKVMVPLSFKK